MTGPAPRKVLFWSDAYYTPAGGTEGQILELIRGLPKGTEAELWITHRSDWLAENPFPCPSRSLELGSLSSPKTWLRLRKIRREIERSGFDLIQTYMCDAGILGPVVGRKLGIPVLVARRDMGFWYTPRLVGAMRRTARLAAGFVANSEAVKRLTVETEHVPSEDVAVVRNGHDLATFDRPRDPDLRARLGIPADARLVGLLANFKPLKRHVDLVEALARLVPRHPTLHALLLGFGPHEHVLALAKERGVADRLHVHYVEGGSVPCLKELDVGVLCSESEGFSNALLEYMGCALPIVATDVGGNPELVADGVNGFLYEVGDAERLAARVAALLTDRALAARMGAASRARIEAEFSRERMVADTLTVYARALAGRPVGESAARSTGGGGGAPAPDRLRVETITDRAALDGLADAWRSLLPPSGFFAGPEWACAWFDAAARDAKPEILVARDDAGRLRGLLALARRGRRLFLPGADVGADHLDLAAAPADRDAVADLLLDRLLAASWGRLELRHLAEDGALRRAIRRRRWALPFTERLSTRCPFIAVEGPFERYLARFSSKHRGNLRRQARALRDDPGCELRRAATPGDVERDLDVLFDLHARRFHGRAESTSFEGPRIRGFHGLLAERLRARGELALTTLVAGGKPAAVHYGFRAGGTLYHFQGGFDPAAAVKSPGTALTTVVLEDDVFGAGLSEYDFLDGTEPYKLALATGERRLYDVEVLRPSLVGRAKALARGGLSLAGRALRRRA